MQADHTGPESGLSSPVAAQLLAQHGTNELPTAKPQNVWRIAWKVITEPMLLLLIACGVIYLLLGDRQEALVLLVFVFVIIGITFFQEHKTERALEALRDLSSPRALVIRDGIPQRIAGRDVVKGDVLVLAEGDRVAADAVLLSCLNLSMDESLLTGESVPVSKALAENEPTVMGQAGGDGLPFVFSGSLVVQGKGMARVIATGAETAIGHIGQALFAVQEEPTRVQRETAQVVRVVAIASILLAVLLACWYAISRHDVLSGVLVGITFAMAVIPEELPVVLMLFLGIGAWRIARQRVLTRRIPAIEMLGATTVLCVDKTGTLTQNKMAVTQLYAQGQVFNCHPTSLSLPLSQLPEEFHEVIEYGILSSHRDPFDPMETAILACGEASLKKTEHLHGDWTLVSEYPLSKELLAMSRVWTSKDLAQLVIAAKGAPEAIADLCHLDPAALQTITAETDRMAAQGLRVLGVAKAQFSTRDSGKQLPAIQATAEHLPPIQHDFEFEFIGLIALADPVRDGVPAAIAECQSAGIRVVMITGDYPATASNIAAQCGIVSPEKVMTGSQINQLSDTELQNAVKTVSVFCRVAPEQKLRLVNVLKSAGEIVAMTGDGVNDAPALKSAHIGIAMGKRGTDVARESASMVLLDDDFFSIVAAIRSGRRIFDNLRKTIAFIIAVHVPVVGMSLIPVMLGWPVVLMPVHILVLQLMIDPTCSLVFEAETEEPDSMRKPPRATDASIFDRRVVYMAGIQGLVLLATVLLVFKGSMEWGYSDHQARALALTSMVAGNIGLVFIHRSLSRNFWQSVLLPNPVIWWVIGSTCTLMALALSMPALHQLFYFEALQLKPLLATLAITLMSTGLLVAIKYGYQQPVSGHSIVR
ncbi:cation-translocating P-type ATPase [Undibacterium sp. SXout7W]|uniref:cation-translocating P-type ATPase n=1 Tax=Undibacterium sp. SXout7W TaxID=3413049 RepID=UPI003BF2AF98